MTELAANGAKVCKVLQYGRAFTQQAAIFKFQKWRITQRIEVQEAAPILGHMRFVVHLDGCEVQLQFVPWTCVLSKSQAWSKERCGPVLPFGSITS